MARAAPRRHLLGVCAGHVVYPMVFFVAAFCASLCYGPAHVAQHAHFARCRICNLQISLEPEGFESHSLRQSFS